MKSLQAASHKCAYHSSSLCLYDMSTYLLCLMSSTGGVYLWLFGRRGGVTVTMSTGRVSSPSLTRTNIHLISSLHPCSETPAWPLPHSPSPPLLLLLSVCVSPSFWPEKRRAQGVSAPLTAGKCLSVVLDLGGVEGGGWRGWGGRFLRGILCRRLLLVLLATVWKPWFQLWWFVRFEFELRGSCVSWFLYINQ